MHSASLEGVMVFLKTKKNVVENALDAESGDSRSQEAKDVSFGF